MIWSKLNSGMYQFVSKVFDLPSLRSVAKYDSVDESLTDGVQFDAVRLLNQKLKESMKIGGKMGRARVILNGYK